MNQETFDRLSYPLALLYEQLELELKKSLIRRFKLHRETTGTIEWETQMLAELGALREENIDILVKVLANGDKELQGLIRRSLEAALEETEPLFDKLPNKDQLVPANMSNRVQQVYKSFYDQAVEKLNLTNTIMIENNLQMYKESIKLYHSILDKGALSVASGQDTRIQAVKKTIQSLIRDGLPALYDRAGRKWSPESYVNMVIRTTTGNTYRETINARMDDWGEDLFYISAHRGARPLCEPYQGLLVSKSNRSGVVEDIDGNKIRFIPLSSTSHGEPAGIFGINCGHYQIIFLPGISHKYELPTKEMMEENDRIYKESQRQRGIERRIRYWKGQYDLAKLSGEQSEIDHAAFWLARANKDMGNLIDDTGRTRRRDREQIYA